MNCKGGEVPPLQGAQPMPSRCPPHAKCQPEWHNRPQPLWQPPPTACLTASGAASEVPSLLMHPWRGGMEGLGPGRGGLKGGGVDPPSLPTGLLNIFRAENCLHNKSPYLVDPPPCQQRPQCKR